MLSCCDMLYMAAGDPRDRRSGPGSETGESPFAAEAVKAASAASPRLLVTHFSAAYCPHLNVGKAIKRQLPAYAVRGSSNVVCVPVS